MMGRVQFATGALHSRQTDLRIAGRRQSIGRESFRFITLGRIGVDQPIVPRLANDQALHQRTHDPAGPTCERSGFRREVKRPPSLPQPRKLSGLRLAVVIHTAQHTPAAVQIQRCVDWSFHQV
jgi:hypothetical protein